VDEEMKESAEQGRQYTATFPVPHTELQSVLILGKKRNMART